jgi:hypothetical protein
MSMDWKSLILIAQSDAWVVIATVMCWNQESRTVRQVFGKDGAYLDLLQVFSVHAQAERAVRIRRMQHSAMGIKGHSRTQICHDVRI